MSVCGATLRIVALSSLPMARAVTQFLTIQSALSMKIRVGGPSSSPSAPVAFAAFPNRRSLTLDMVSAVNVRLESTILTTSKDGVWLFGPLGGQNDSNGWYMPALPFLLIRRS